MVIAGNMADQTEGKRKRSSVSLLNDPGGESVQYISKNLPQKGFSMLNVMRSKAQLCDVTMKIGDRQIVAHKAVLAATVPYFYAMFTSRALSPIVHFINIISSSSPCR